MIHGRVETSPSSGCQSGQKSPVSRVQSLTKQVQTEHVLILGSGDCILNPWLQLTGTGSNKSPRAI